MKKKLTLSLEQAVIEQAKAYAKQRGKSVSQLVGEHFDALTRQAGETATGRPGQERPLPETVQALIGIAEGDEETYRRHLEKKHQ